MCCNQRVWCHFSIFSGRCDHHDLINSGYLCRYNVHQYRRWIYSFPARHIYTDSVKWCDFLSQDCSVRFAVEPAVLSLFFMIRTDVQKSFADDLHQFWIYFFICLFNLLFCNLNIVCSDICMIKFLRICKYCLILFFFYMSEDFLNSLFILTVIIRASLQKILQ